MSPRPCAELTTPAEFLQLGNDVRHRVLQGIDFRGHTIEWSNYTFHDVVFLGCRFDEPSATAAIVEAGGVVFPRLPNLPYDPYRSSLYSWQELGKPALEGSTSIDEAIYRHFQASRGRVGIVEALAQRIHDHAMDDGLTEEIEGQRLVGIMGGHGTRRDSEDFRRAAEIARGLTRAGYLIASGGGPGTMEAANLGAWLAPHEDGLLDRALETLCVAPSYSDDGFEDAALEVLEFAPSGARSVAIPTWFYGHEPSNVFATAIAKYFSNSLREDCLLAICLHGIVFCPGSAGTTQEIFQDAAQNHYGTFGHISPMVFVGENRYVGETSLWQTIQELAAGRRYGELMTLTDDPAEVVRWIETHPPLDPE